MQTHKKNYFDEINSLISYIQSTKLDIPKKMEDVIHKYQQNNLNDDKKIQEIHQELKKLVANSLLKDKLPKDMPFFLFIASLSILVYLTLTIIPSFSFAPIKNVNTTILLVINTALLGNSLFCLWEIKKHYYLLKEDSNTRIYIWFRFAIGVTVTAFIFLFVLDYNNLKQTKILLLAILMFPIIFFLLQDMVIKIVEYAMKPKALSITEQQKLINKEFFSKLTVLHEKIQNNEIDSVKILAESISKNMKIKNCTIIPSSINCKRNAEEFFLQLVLTLLPEIAFGSKEIKKEKITSEKIVEPKNNNKKEKNKKDSNMSSIALAEQYTEKTLEKLGRTEI